MGIDAANQIPWDEFRKMMTDEYRPSNELQMMEQELWDLTVIGDDIEGQEAVRAYDATPNEGKAYAGNLAFFNRCKLHHNGPCTVMYRNCQRVSHQTKDCWSKTRAANTPPTDDVN
ncbi:hypothetical protein Tco_0606025 [Tanacetum coccineum]